MKRRIKIVHLITGVGNGGAERSLVQLVEGLDSNRFECVVVTLAKDQCFYQQRIEKACKLYSLEARQGWLFFTKIFALYKIIKKENPDILQTWLYHADLIGIVLGKLIGVKRILWNVHSTLLPSSVTPKSTILIRKINAWLSRFTTGIINCSKKSIREHIRIGYSPEKFIYIPNGYDCRAYYPINFTLRDTFKISPDDFVIGVVGRFHPVKDHLNFLQSLVFIKAKFPSIKALLVGKNIDKSNTMLMNFIIQNDLNDNVVLLGERSDLLNLYNTLDMLVLSSISEAFPNVIAEAMACGKPCVVTDVGDAAYIVAETGIVVPTRNPKLLADGVLQMIAFGKDRIAEQGKSARNRIIQNFSLDKMIQSYNDLYLGLIISSRGLVVMKNGN